MALDEYVRRQRDAVLKRAQSEQLASYRHRAGPSRRSLRAHLQAADSDHLLACTPIAPWTEAAPTPEERLVRALAPHAAALAVGPPTRAASESTDAASSAYEVVRTASSLPVLSTELVVAAEQLAQMRHFGVDAVMLSLAALDDEAYGACLEEAERLALDVVALVRDEHELRRAVGQGDILIGIDNRDFANETFAIERTEQLAKLVPDGRTTIGVGGAGTRSQCLSLRRHCDVLLVGDAILADGRPERRLRTLLYGRVKVCGLTRPEDAELSWESGATYGGVLFGPANARRVSYDRARDICQAAPLSSVGVFVDRPVSDVVSTARSLGLAAVQLHGAESNDYLLELRRRLPESVELWRAMHVEGEAPRLHGLYADRIFLDNFARGIGGTSTVFDWSIVADLTPEQRRMLILGGGLSAENAEYAAGLGVWGLDVNRGVEVSAGWKSPAHLERLFDILAGRRRLRGTAGLEA